MRRSVRTSIRIDTGTKACLSRIAESTGMTMTGVVVKLISITVHKLQTDMFSDNERDELLRNVKHSDATETIDLRLPAIMTDYLKLNGYRATACLYAALKNYA